MVAESSAARPQHVPPAPAEGSPVLRMALGSQLRRRREAAGVSREDAAWTLRASAPKISRMELGRVRVKERDVLDLLTRYGVDDEAERAAFVALVHRANADGWWQRDRDLLPSWFETYLGMEQAATLIRTYEVQFVPVLLQTEEYARAVVGLARTDTDEIERRVALRMRRQAVLEGPTPPRVWAVLDEAVLRRPVAGPDVTRRQLDHLIDLAARTEVTLQVAAFGQGPLPATGGPFTMLRFDSPDLPDVVYLEHLNSALYLDKPGDVEDYATVWNRLCVAVESPSRTLAVLRRIRGEVR
jgi:transcriptional regulator with XRE-family HTH domain